MVNNTVILHFSDWNSEYKHYRLPRTLFVEFKTKLKKNGFAIAWEFFTRHIDYDHKNDGSKPITLLYSTTAEDVFFLDHSNQKECIDEWEEDLEGDTE